ncbi:hypothetical protein ACFCW7_24080 [Paenibacillus glucanolyticus]|uniref:hypothetical protein n=1 Tax=Paenibacillus glucanolyticus TaxID=59843 RepID=UPI001CE1EDFD|nr:hypothetical protein [Mycolicibacterium fortuitum]
MVEYNDKRWGAELEKMSKSRSKSSESEHSGEDFIEDSLNKISAPDLKKHDTGIWIKFEGSGEQRIPNHEEYLKRKVRLFEHTSRTFFPRRPRSIKQGQIVFMAVVSYDQYKYESPIIIGYGEAEGFEETNEIGRDDRFYQATQGRYKYFIELKNGRYLNSPVKNRISIIQLRRDLGSNLYPTYKEHPSQILATHHQQSHLQITDTARDYLINELNKLFQVHGCISSGTYHE